MSGSAENLELRWAWTQQRVWSRTADELKHRLDLARRVALLLAIGAAVLAVAATQVTGPSPIAGRALGAAAAIAAGLATTVQRRVGTDRVLTWTRARSVSEGLKTEVYSYLAGGTAYTDPTTRDDVLAGRARGMVRDAADVQRHTLDVDPDTRPVPAITGLEDYLRSRVDDQIANYYRPRARRYEHRVRHLRGLGDALGVVTVVLAALAASLNQPALAAWVPVATTAGTSLVAHIAAARYDHLIIEYLRTAQRLEDLRSERVDGPAAEAQLVDACEAAISTENQGWMARWTTQHDEPA